jgi:hypothetical protein
MFDNNGSEKITATESLGSLRNEIVESQKARMDFLKYKLLAIAALGAIGLGFSEHNGSILEPDYILCIIPFVCMYVDLLCYHNDMRILVIGNFLGYSGDSYENYIGKLGAHNGRPNRAGYYFELENFSLHWSSVFSGGCLALYGYGIYSKYFQILNAQYKGSPESKGVFFILFGIISILIVFLYREIYEQHKQNLFATAGELKRQITCGDCTKKEDIC